MKRPRKGSDKGQGKTVKRQGRVKERQVEGTAAGVPPFISAWSTLFRSYMVRFVFSRKVRERGQLS